MPVRAALLPWVVSLAAAAAPGPVAGGPITLPIDAARSELRFTISRPGETIDGHAHQFSGEARLVPERPGDGASVTLTVQAASLETGNRLRDRKMRNSHLEVEQFPSILFRSTAITVAKETAGEAPPVPPGARRVVIEGVVGLHGVERSILFPALIRYDNAALEAEGEFSIRLTDHGIAIPRIFWIVLDDEVKVHFRFAAGRRSDAPAGTPVPAQ